MTFRREREINPISFQDVDQRDRVLEIHILNKEGIGAELVSAIHIGNEIRRGQDDDRHSPEAVLLANPGKHFVAIHGRHTQVEEDEVGKRVLGAVGEFAFAAKIRDGLVPIAYYLDRVDNTGGFESSGDQKNVVVLIFDE